MKRTLINQFVRTTLLVPMCLIAFSFVSVPMLAESVVTVLTVHVKDGSEVSFLLSERPSVTYSDDYMLITSADAETSYPLSDVLKFTFEEIDGEDTGIDSTIAAEASFSLDGGVIVVSGLKAGSTAQVFTLGGVMVHSESVDSGSWSYPLSSLSSGIYIISINGKGFKITKK